jgi:hypothetical protein
MKKFAIKLFVSCDPVENLSRSQSAAAVRERREYQLYSRYGYKGENGYVE